VSHPDSRPPHPSQRDGLHSTTWLGASTKARVEPSWPGGPPRLRPEGVRFARSTFGPSLDGGFEELVEFCPRCCSNRSTRASSSAAYARKARFCSQSASISACASGNVEGSGGRVIGSLVVTDYPTLLKRNIGSGQHWLNGYRS
jgi:hypothetical protein